MSSTSEAAALNDPSLSHLPGFLGRTASFTKGIDIKYVCGGVVHAPLPRQPSSRWYESSMIPDSVPLLSTIHFWIRGWTGDMCLAILLHRTSAMQYLIDWRDRYGGPTSYMLYYCCSYRSSADHFSSAGSQSPRKISRTISRRARAISRRSSS